jgi:aryl-alcohol dehydrogenase-like predicted oxidoreductase
LEQRSIAGFKVSVLGLGTSRLASLGAGGSLRDAARLLDAAADLGVSFVDTADTYGSTQCERWLGELMHKRSHQFVVATKCGLPTVDLPRPFRALNQPAKKLIQRTGPRHYLQPSHVRRSIDASLNRLRRERIEIYLVHEPPAGVERMDDLFSVLDAARADGKIGVYGVCSGNTEVISAVVAANRCDVVETAASPPVTSRLQASLGPARDPGSVDVVANHVLAGGMRSPVAVQGTTSQAATLLDGKLDQLTAERGVSRAHLLIRHAAAVHNVRVVLTGTSNPAHLAQNVAALELRVTSEDLLA